MIVHLIFDGVADGPLGIGLDVVGTAARLVKAGLVPANPPQQVVVSVDGAPVRTQAGRTMGVDGALDPERLGPGDVLVLPGLGAATGRELDALLALADVNRAAAAIARASARGALIAGSCSATFVLAAAGVLDGRQATTTWWLGPLFAARFPRVALRSDRMVVHSEGVFTAGSAFAHADLMLAVVAHALGPAAARLVAKYLILDERPSQARYMVLEHLRTSDPAMLDLERYLLANADKQVSLQEMARAAALSPRTLARRVWEAAGTTPRRFAQRLKVAQAIHLLETTQDPVDAIATRVGYADAAAFRRVFRRETGEAPSDRRR
jgi:transcriptional regulator GlxA family with amidase domain